MSLLDTFVNAEKLRSEIAPMREFFLAIRTDGPPDGNDMGIIPVILGDGTRENPFDASTARRFNRIISLNKGAAGKVVFRLGPGLFRTTGTDNLGLTASPPLVLRSGTRFVGAGMFNTIIRLATIKVPTDPTFRNIGGIVSEGLQDNIEISDLTIDCDLEHQPSTPGLDFSRICLGAIFLTGNNNRIRRVRLINFGTRTPIRINRVGMRDEIFGCLAKATWNLMAKEANYGKWGFNRRARRERR
jgi:hypothetical protein